MPGKCGTLLRVRFTEGLGLRAERSSAATMFWMLPQLAMHWEEGKPEALTLLAGAPKPRTPKHAISRYGGWTRSSADSRCFARRGASLRSS
jgi:hypothetical protein